VARRKVAARQIKDLARLVSNFGGLGLLGATAEQHHDGLAVLDVVDAPARSEVNAQLTDSFPYRGYVARKAMRKAL
jgi:hypothetical protein